MKKLIIAGPGNSGSGAIFDFFKSREDFFPLLDDEFRLVNDPYGIQNLEENFYNNFSINNCANAYYNFRLFCDELSNYKILKGGNVYPHSFKSDYHKFNENIIVDCYNGLPRFVRFKLNLFEKFKLHFLKIFLKKKIKDINIFKMIIPVNREKFVSLSIDFIDQIVKSSNNFEKNKICLIDQGVNLFNLNNNLKYFSDSKCIVVLRDPRGTFLTIKKLLNKNIAYAYQGLEINKFIPWYRNLYNRINKLSFDKQKVITVKFEDFILKYESECSKLIDFLGVNSIKSKFDVNKSMYNFYDIEKDLTNNELHIIKNELKDFLLY